MRLHGLSRQAFDHAFPALVFLPDPSPVRVLQDSCIAALQWAAKEGVLAEENMRGINFEVRDLNIVIHHGYLSCLSSYDFAANQTVVNFVQFCGSRQAAVSHFTTHQSLRSSYHCLCCSGQLASNSSSIY